MADVTSDMYSAFRGIARLTGGEEEDEDVAGAEAVWPEIFDGICYTRMMVPSTKR